MLGPVRPIVDRAAGLLRWSGEGLESLGRRLESERAGEAERAAPKDLDDVTLARKVETTLFRSADAPKGSVDIDVVDGVVTLRGEVRTPEDILALEREAQAVPEVRAVENLLKLPKTPSRTRADAPGRSKRTGGRKPGAGARGRSTTATSGRFNTEREPAVAEPGPQEHAATRQGRTPAPFGSDEPPPAQER